MVAKLTFGFTARTGAGVPVQIRYSIILSEESFEIGRAVCVQDKVCPLKELLKIDLFRAISTSVF